MYYKERRFCRKHIEKLLQQYNCRLEDLLKNNDVVFSYEDFWKGKKEI